MSQRRVFKTRRFHKDVRSVPQNVRTRIGNAVEQIKDHPLPHRLDIKKLRGYKQNIFRVRVGDYRFTYSFDTACIYLRTAGHRKDIYE